MVKKYKNRRINNIYRVEPIQWLPFDSRLVTPFISFGSVKGLARIFLQIEITLAVLCVLGTLLVAFIRIFGLMDRYIF